MISRNDPCWCGSNKKWKKCHFPELAAQSFSQKQKDYFKKHQIILKTPQQIKGIRKACQLSASILKKVCSQAKIGVTTNELNDYALKLHKEAGAKPAPLGYGDPPFPGAICTSLNEVICHGIPNDKPLKEGDIMNIDVTCILNGFYGDCSAMVTLGDVSKEKKALIDASYQSLMRAIALLKPGIPVSAIGHEIETYAQGLGFSVVNQFVAHGVGIDFHENPQIPHHFNQIDIPLEEGMTFTIEPMINLGKRGAVIDPIDKWTARTVDNLPSAQWEHTLLITQDSYEILTLPN